MELRPQQDAPSRRPRRRFAPGVLALVSGLACVPACGSDWRYDEPFSPVSTRIAAWLDEPAAVALWRDGVAETRRASRAGDALLAAAAVADRRVASLFDQDTPPGWLAPSEPASASLRLAVAERLALERRYDACLAWTEGLAPEKVYSPGLLKYLRALALSQIVDDEAAREEISGWGDWETSRGVDELGEARWWVVKSLVSRSEKKAEPLPTVTRRMRDIERRLSLDQAGPETQDQQQKVLDELDKLIKKLEEQRRQQQQQQAAAGGAKGADPGSPAEESRPSELKGAGEVDPKRLVKGDPWGSLPPAERERLTQAITRDLPPHYRSLVEDYFRTLADGERDRADEEGRR